MPLPVSIVIPTLNCRGEIEPHLAALKRWYHEAEEVIVVDSESDDGTAEWLRENVDHPRAKFCSRPRGLYAAWNFGVSQCHAEFVYFATVGDEIIPEGVRKLVEVAKQFDAEVVISPPRMIDIKGNPVKSASWPIHRFLHYAKPVDALLLSDRQKFVLTTSFGIGGLLGSSASNLYQRATLALKPFPEHFGHAGDSLWGRQHCSSLRIALSANSWAAFVTEDSKVSEAFTDGGCIDKHRQLDEASLREALCLPDGDFKAEALLMLEGRDAFQEWVCSKITELEHLRSTCEQQLEYIQTLEEACSDRLKEMDRRGGEIERLRKKLNSTLGRRLISLFR